MAMGGELKNVGSCVPSKVSVTERLEGQKKELEARLERINKALEALKKNPEVAEVVNTISRIDCLY